MSAQQKSVPGLGLKWMTDDEVVGLKPVVLAELVASAVVASPAVLAAVASSPVVLAERAASVVVGVVGVVEALAHGTPETTPSCLCLVGFSSLSFFFRKHTSLRPSSPRTFPQVQAPHCRASASHFALHASALRMSCISKRESLVHRSRPSTPTPQAIFSSRSISECTCDRKPLLWRPRCSHASSAAEASTPVKTTEVRVRWDILDGASSKSPEEPTSSRRLPGTGA
mmetsp:Transcript_5106/g.13849  ORF Transcript_5106/g.13849 Transcript_5106/m.13849 type:complete len:227 (-) Transcript_5106:62-742(-)